MTNQEIITKLKTNYNQQHTILSSFPDIDFIGHLSDDVVFLNNVHTFDEFLIQLSYFDHEHLELGYYYMSSGALAIHYTYKSIQLVFFCSDYTHALEELSNGGCIIQEKSARQLTKQVVCLNGE